MAKTKPVPEPAPTTLVDTAAFAAAFFRRIETTCTVKGVVVEQGQRYGLRLNDRIELPVNGSVHTTDVVSYWRHSCKKRKIDSDLAVAADNAVNRGLLQKKMLMGHEPGKKDGPLRPYGMQYWTPDNLCFRTKPRADGKVSTRPTSAQIADALGDF